MHTDRRDRQKYRKMIKRNENDEENFRILTLTETYRQIDKKNVQKKVRQEKAHIPKNGPHLTWEYYASKKTKRALKAVLTTF